MEQVEIDPTGAAAMPAENRQQRLRREACRTVLVASLFVLLSIPALLILLHMYAGSQLPGDTKDGLGSNITVCYRVANGGDNYGGNDSDTAAIWLPKQYREGNVTKYCIEYVNASFKMYGRLILLSIQH